VVQLIEFMAPVFALGFMADTECVALFRAMDGCAARAEC